MEGRWVESLLMSLPFALVLLSQHLLPCPPCLQVVDDVESDDGGRYGLGGCGIE